MNALERNEFVKMKKLSFNCFQRHDVVQCNSRYVCEHCSLKHNSLLHTSSNENPSLKANERNFESKQNTNSLLSASKVDQPEGISCSPESTTLSLSAGAEGFKNVLLSTAEVYLETPAGQRICARAVLDTGSQINLMTSECADIMGLKKEKISYSLTVKNKTKTIISNSEESFKRNAEFLVVQNITNFIPSTKLDTSKLKLPDCIKLADP